MSGHSKWATTKHKKAVIDARRGNLFAKLVKNIEVATRISGPDPDSNPALFDAIQKQIKTFLDANQYRMDVFDPYITKAWATFSVKGQHIASHKHTASHFSLVYYVKAEDQGNVVFQPEEALKGGLYIPARDDYYKGWSDINFASVTYPSETGGLIIFPSHLLHHTQENTKDTPRISVSADILLTMKEGIKSEHCLPSPDTWKKI